MELTNSELAAEYYQCKQDKEEAEERMRQIRKKLGEGTFDVKGYPNRVLRIYYGGGGMRVSIKEVRKYLTPSLLASCSSYSARSLNAKFMNKPSPKEAKKK